ncbi:MAG: SRPBCC family protein [Ktedonobacterales bacterium]
MGRGLVANASSNINAPRARVWDALVNPDLIKQYLFGTTVVSDWNVGSPIVWKGEWQGKAYEDKGVLLRLEPERLIEYSHFSPLAGQPDTPDNYHTVTVEVSEMGEQTRVSLSQDNNASEEERQHSEAMWGMMLANLKKILES